MDLISDITGVILCGGKSSRFGSDKAFATYGGRSFFDRIADVMRSVFEKVIVVTNSPHHYSDRTFIVLEDEIPHQGPMGGIITALRFIHEHNGTAIFVVACDMPLLRETLIRKMLAADDGSALLAYEREGRIEPLCALYRCLLLPFLESRQQEGRYALHTLAQSLKTVRLLTLEDEEALLLWNVNTPEDLNAIECSLEC